MNWPRKNAKRCPATALFPLFISRKWCGRTATSTIGGNSRTVIGLSTSFGWKERNNVSLMTKLLLLVSLSITASVGAVAWLIQARTHESFRQAEQDRTAALVSQFRREFDHEGEEITRGVEAVAGTESLVRTVLELSNSADQASYFDVAGGYAATQHLDFLDLLAPDGTIISSAHWPARFGYKQRWFLEQAGPTPPRPFLRHVDTADGSTLAMLCVRPVYSHAGSYYLVGGRKIDQVLQSLATPTGVRVAIYSAPEGHPGEMLGASSGQPVPGQSKDNFDSTKLMPLVKKVLDQHNDTSATIDWGAGQPQQEIGHAIAMPGFGDRIPAVLLVANSLDQEISLEKHIGKISLIIALLGLLAGVILIPIIAPRVTHPSQDLP